LGESMDLFFESFLVSMMRHPQPHLPTITAYGSNNRGTVMIISAMPALWLMFRTSAYYVGAQGLAPLPCTCI
jgi:hypothetical protein